MPFYRFYGESFDDSGEEESNEPQQSGEFTYDGPTEGKFRPLKLGNIAREAMEALKALGAKSFRIRYDGGSDEGFAHADSATFAKGTVSIADLIQLISKSPAASEIRSIATVTSDSRWGNAQEIYGKGDDVEVVEHAVDELAYEIASVLLGEGYGTGEYELYGALTADLETGEIIDDPAAKPNEI